MDAGFLPGAGIRATRRGDGSEERRWGLAFTVDTYDDFKGKLEDPGGFLLAHWDGTAETEERIKKETKATIRCLLLDDEAEEGQCILTGKASPRRVLFARAY